MVAHLKRLAPCGFTGCTDDSTQTLISHHGVRIKDFCDAHGDPALEWWLKASDKMRDTREQEAMGWEEGDVTYV